MSNTTQITIHKPKDPILILEDTKENQALLKGICKKMDVPYVIAENGEIALELLEKEKFSIYLVDLMMPVMDGRSFIRNLKKKYPESIILVQTALDSPDTIVNIMKLGIFDYIFKPIDIELFQQTVSKGLEYKYLKDMEREIAINAEEQIRNQIDWLNYKEERRTTNKEHAEIKSIYNLKTSLSQGTGFGSLLTLIDILKRSKKDEGDTYSIEKQVVDLMIDNYDICSNQLNGLHSISRLLEGKIPLKKTDAATLVQAIPGIIKKVIPYFESKGIEVSYPELKMNYSLELNMEKMSLLIEELFINAAKYSVPGSRINSFSHTNKGYFCLSIMNEVSEKPYGGILPEYEKLVVEPFFRLHPPDEAIGKIEKFGLGLGLTVVDSIAKKHNGMFMIHGAVDHSFGKRRSVILAEVMLPLIQEEKENLKQ